MLNLTTSAMVLAAESEAQLRITAGVSYDTADRELAIMADALLSRVAGTGIDLLALRRDGTLLTAIIDDSGADEPLCPAAFGRVVRHLSYHRLGDVWEARLVVEPTRPTARKQSRVA